MLLIFSLYRLSNLNGTHEWKFLKYSYCMMRFYILIRKHRNNMYVCESVKYIILICVCINYSNLSNNIVFMSHGNIRFLQLNL